MIHIYFTFQALVTTFTYTKPHLQADPKNDMHKFLTNPYLLTLTNLPPTAVVYPFTTKMHILKSSLATETKTLHPIAFGYTAPIQNIDNIEQTLLEW